MDYPDYPFYCTLQQSRKVWRGGRHNLDIIAARCGFNLENHHNALADAEACAAIAREIL
jgi:DNA polymerase-3 subunit epsilon